MVSTTFIYRPRSNSRVFIEASHASIGVLLHANGCRHVVGGCHLQYFTARQGAEYWRGEAVALATALVEGYGGIAWDDRGEVHLVVPTSAGVEVDATMVAIRPTSEPDDSTVAENRINRARLLISGAGYIHEGWLCHHGAYIPDVSVRVQRPQQVHAPCSDAEGHIVPGLWETTFVAVLDDGEREEGVTVRYPWCPEELLPLLRAFVAAGE